MFIYLLSDHSKKENKKKIAVAILGLSRTMTGAVL